MGIPPWLEIIRSQAIRIEVDLQFQFISFVFEGEVFGLEPGWLVALNLGYDDGSRLFQVALQQKEELDPDLSINAALRAESEAARLDANQYIEWNKWVEICAAIERKHQAAQKMLKEKNGR